MAMRRLALLAVLAAAPLAAQQLPRDATEGLSGLPVPRFVALAAGEANMRSGPGDNYPITWIYRRKGLPVEIVREYGIWRQVRDPGGTVGWVNKNLLTGERHAYVTKSVRTLYERPDVQSRAVWRAEPGVVARILLCEQAWCNVSVEGRSGYILRNQIWGVYPNEAID
jgi:SH3-like domain-containing protein